MQLSAPLDEYILLAAYAGYFHVCNMLLHHAHSISGSIIKSFLSSQIRTLCTCLLKFLDQMMRALSNCGQIAYYLGIVYTHWYQDWGPNDQNQCANFYFIMIIKNQLRISKSCNMATVNNEISYRLYLLHYGYMCTVGHCLVYSGPRLNIKTVFPSYGDYHVKDKTVARPSYL